MCQFQILGRNVIKVGFYTKNNTFVWFYCVFVGLTLNKQRKVFPLLSVNFKIEVTPIYGKPPSFNWLWPLPFWCSEPSLSGYRVNPIQAGGPCRFCAPLPVFSFLCRNGLQ